MVPTRRQVAAGLAVAALLAAGILASPAAVVGRLGAAVESPFFPALLVGLYLLRPLLAWPITALSVLVGYRYGVAVGLPVALAGAVLTSLLPYAFARHYRDRPGPFGVAVAGSERFFEATGGLRGVVAIRLAPTPAEPVSLAAGAAGVPLVSFVVGTAIGELPWTVAAVLAGHSLSRLSVAGAVGAGPWLLIAGLAAAALLLAGPAYRWAVGRLQARATEPS